MKLGVRHAMKAISERSCMMCGGGGEGDAV